MNRPAGTGAQGPFDRRLLRRARPARAALAASVAVGLVATGAAAVQALLLARLVTSAVPGSGGGAPRAALAAGLAGAVVVRAACGLVGERLGLRGAQRVKAALRAELVGAGLSRADAPARGARPAPGGPAGPGELATLAARGLDALDAYVARCLPDLVLAVVAPALLIAVIASTDWLSAVVVLASVLLFPLFGALVGWATGERARARWAEVAALGDHLVDLFEGLPVLRSYARTGRERARLETMGERLRLASVATLRLAFVSALVLDTLASVSTALVAVPIGIRLVGGDMSLAPGLAALLLTPEVFLPLRRASAEFHESAEGRVASARVLDLLERPGEPGPPPAGAGAPGRPRRRVPAAGARAATVALEGVTLRLPGRAAPVLEGVDLAVAPGETVVVVGSNGAGKSTILALALGLLVPTSGTVRAAGSPLGEVALAAWRARCAYLADRPGLLPATIAENLRVADPGADEARLARALEDAGWPGWRASLPEGLATRVGPGGWALSAGERQRVALARALVRDADLYLLDEPTAHLDPATEALVVDRLHRRLAGRSALLVTHRLAPLALADRVVRLEGGAAGVAPTGPGAPRPGAGDVPGSVEVTA